MHGVVSLKEWILDSLKIPGRGLDARRGLKNISSDGEKTNRQKALFNDHIYGPDYMAEPFFPFRGGDFGNG